MTPCSGPTPSLMWSNRALKTGPGGVLSCVTYGSYTQMAHTKDGAQDEAPRACRRAESMSVFDPPNNLL